MNFVVKSVADFFVAKNITSESEREILEYGLFLVINDIVTFSMILLISCIFSSPRFAIEFLTVFCMTRIYCGGYHARKAYVCKLSMIGTFVSIYLISLLNVDLWFVILLLFVGHVVVIKLAPVKHPNKQLNEKEEHRNRKFAIITYFSFSILCILLFVFVGRQDGIIVAMSLVSVALFAIIGKTSYERRENNEKAF